MLLPIAFNIFIHSAEEIMAPKEASATTELGVIAERKLAANSADIIPVINEIINKAIVLDFERVFSVNV
ncbi:hypothetical protein SPM24T3_18066 [Serratia sp. M24T3]|nr:hypothetical protein SPM24T3_18066 [Serratia sp. M24T3]